MKIINYLLINPVPETATYQILCKLWLFFIKCLGKMLILCGLLLFIWTGSGVIAEGNTTKNIVFIIADDLVSQEIRHCAHFLKHD